MIDSSSNDNLSINLASSWSSTVNWSSGSTSITVVNDAPPTCPQCSEQIVSERSHATGCPYWGMLPEHWSSYDD